MYVFVYGTLKKGFSNHHILKEATFIGLGITQQPFELYSLYYPCLFESNKGERVYGEVYDVSKDLLHVLDIFESTPDLYYRKEIEVNIKGKIEKAFVYFSNEEKPKNLKPLKEIK